MSSDRTFMAPGPNRVNTLARRRSRLSTFFPKRAVIPLCLQALTGELVHQSRPFEEILHLHELLGVVGAMSIAHEDHARRHPGIRENCRIMSRSTRNGFRRVAQLVGGRDEPLDDCFIHPRGFGVYPLVKLECHPTLV